MGSALIARTVVPMVFLTSPLTLSAPFTAVTVIGVRVVCCLLDSANNLPIHGSCGGCIVLEKILTSSPARVPIGVTVVMRGVFCGCHRSYFPLKDAFLGGG